MSTPSEVLAWCKRHERIRTPGGKRITAPHYLSLHRARLHSQAGAFDCEHGHFECAAWALGPCEHEVAISYPVRRVWYDHDTHEWVCSFETVEGDILFRRWFNTKKEALHG